ncbi:MAG: DUF1273 family protein [Clostridia bacterium]|nr:DUF1273 family protein [Clostridia bacterium]
MNFTCCFTGHRVLPAEQIECLYRELDRVLDILIRSGVSDFRVGGALGFDTLAALCVLDKRRVCPHLRLELCIPCADQANAWSDSDRQTYEYIRSQADKVTVLSEKYTRGCMHRRNRYMVDGSDYCVAYCTADKGGSAYTVNYAKKKGVKVVDLALYMKKENGDGDGENIYF